jgi:hypothetical protein
MTAFLLPNYRASDLATPMNRPALQASLEPVTLISELRAWAFDFVMQPNWSIRQHCRWFFGAVIMLVAVVFLATQMDDAGGPFFPLYSLARFVSQLGIAFGVLATFFASMRLSWRIRYENYRRGYRG